MDELAKNGQTALELSTECVVGSVFPSFECTTITHQKIDATYFKGKVSIVNFWFENCAPCVAEVPGFNQLVKTYGKDKLRYLAISSDSQEDVAVFLKDHAWDFDHVGDGASLIKDVFHRAWGYPTTFLVDQNGIIVKCISGGKTDATAVQHIQEELMPSIDRLLKGSL
jgi:thiol-disulfide isomerase/thioredoxin